MMPSAVATLLESLAAAPECPHVPRDRYLCEIATAVESVPLVHPVRNAIGERPNQDGAPVPVLVDRALGMAADIRRGEATANTLRAFAAELRAGEAEMRATGWGWMLP